MSRLHLKDQVGDEFYCTECGGKIEIIQLGGKSKTALFCPYCGTNSLRIWNG
jgi:DNA-directed RNA polymerase subunit RPC12/RpoP